MRRRHPSPLELGAYFDGESVEGVAGHVARCRKCRESLDELAGVRCAVRGELDLTDGSARRRARWTVALIPVAAAVALLLAVAAPPGGLPVTRVENADQAALAPAPPRFEPIEAADVTAPPDAPVDVDAGPSAPPAAGRAGSVAAAPKAPAPAAEPTSGAPSASGAKPTAAARRSTAAAASGPAGGRGAPVPAGPLRLGVPVPTRGVSSGEGGEVLRAVRAVVKRTNDAGGAAGRPVEVIAVPIDRDDRRAEALARVDALVGGFAFDAPAGMPWVMPADVAPTGADVAAGELAAEQAGAVLGADLVARSAERPATIGAVVGSGPDAGLVTGLARSVPVQQVSAGGDTSCHQEVVALRKRDVAALALAVPPDLARRCAAAAARMGWRPPGGLLLAPSAVYAHLERDLVVQGARSAVALPAPDGDDPGSVRFRRSCPGCDSHRSLMSFAAAELAVTTAGTTGVLTMSVLRDRRWQSDLYDVSGGQHTTSHVVGIRFGRWANASPSRPPAPGYRRGVLNPFGDLVAWRSEGS